MTSQQSASTQPSLLPEILNHPQEGVVEAAAAVEEEEEEAVEGEEVAAVAEGDQEDKQQEEPLQEEETRNSLERNHPPSVEIGKMSTVFCRTS